MIAPSDDRRVCIFSMRDVSKQRYRCNAYEFEDVIAQIDSVDFANLLMPTKHVMMRHRIKSRLKRHVPVINKLAKTGFQTQKISRGYDLFFAYLCTGDDLALLRDIDDWRDCASFKVCWLQEIWLKAIFEGDFDLDVLNDFDHVICSMSESAAHLSNILSVPVSYIPWGVDAVSSCPAPSNPRRVIDFNNISNVAESTHNALKRLAREQDKFYLYETLGGNPSVVSYTEHRERFVEYIKRSRYFFVQGAKKQNPERGQQTEFGVRYLEGAAGGAVLLGEAVDSDAFRKHLGWQDSVIVLPFECPDIADVVSGLDFDKERLAEISSRNVIECLKNHDYAYRWEEVLKLAGMSVDPRTRSRRNLLCALTEAV